MLVRESANCQNSYDLSFVFLITSFDCPGCSRGPIDTLDIASGKVPNFGDRVMRYSHRDSAEDFGEDDEDGDS
jgi:hypothetical protein